MNEDYPLMASAIYRSDKPIELIMLWGLPFENMSVKYDIFCKAFLHGIMVGIVKLGKGIFG